MRVTFTWILFLTCAFFLSRENCAQVRVTAHATAEIVEGWQAAPKTRNQIYVQPGKSEPIAMGEIFLIGGRAAVCNVMIQSGPLTGEQGNQVSFNAGSFHPESNLQMDNNGRQTLKIYGSSKEDLFTNPDHNYSGTYQVNFVYN